MATPILSDRTDTIDRLTQTTIHRPNVLIRSVDLVSFRYLSKADKAICQIRDLATGAIRQTLASKLLPISYGKDTYLLEFISAVEGSDDV